MDNQPCDNLFMETLERINSKLKFYCQHLSWCSKIVEEDDCYQEAVLKMLERSRIDPEYLNQNDSYITWYGIWMVKNYINHQRNLFYKKITEEDDLDLGEPDFHLRVNHAPKPENETVKLEVHLLAEGMPDGYKCIFENIVEGYSSEEIMKKMKIGGRTLRKRKETMVKVLGEAYHAPLNQKEEIIKNMDPR